MKCGFKIGGGIDQDYRKSPQGYTDNVSHVRMNYYLFESPSPFEEDSVEESSWGHKHRLDINIGSLYRIVCESHIKLIRCIAPVTGYLRN